MVSRFAPSFPALRRAVSLLETVVALAFVLAMLPALVPPPQLEAGALRERFERTQARLIVEGELDRAALLAEGGRLAEGSKTLSGRPYPASEELVGLRLTRRVRKAGAGLLEVEIQARWRCQAPTAPDQEQALTLTTWAGR